MVSYVLFNIDTVRRCCLLETLQSDNGDKNVAEKWTLPRSFDTFLPLHQVTQLL